MIRRFKDEGYRVGAIKHDAHDFDTDHPGTDTWRHRKAGADAIAITSQRRTAIVSEKHTPLQELLQQMRTMDFVFVEGFKHEPYPKIVIVKKKGDEMLVQQLDHVRAVVTWLPECNLGFDGVPVFSIHDSESLFQWVCRTLIKR